MAYKHKKTALCTSAFLCMLLFLSCDSSIKKNKRSNRIVVEANVSRYFHRNLNKLFDIKDKMNIIYYPFIDSTSKPAGTAITEDVVDGKVRWEFYSSNPVTVIPPLGLSIVMNPGDSIHIDYVYDYPVYTGIGKVSLSLLTELMKIDEAIDKPDKKNSYNAKTLEDFLEWNKYLNTRLTLQMQEFTEYKKMIPAVEYEYYSGYIVNNIEGDRIDAFEALYNSVVNGSVALSYDNLNTIWDSSEYNSWAKWFRNLPDFKGSVDKLYLFNKMETCKQFGFDSKNDSLSSNEARVYLYYTNAKKNFRGALKEKLLVYILEKQAINNLGVDNKITQTLLTDFYNQPHFAEYKRVVKELENSKKINQKQKA